jgi:hypothetical protein
MWWFMGRIHFRRGVRPCWSHQDGLTHYLQRLIDTIFNVAIGSLLRSLQQTNKQKWRDRPWTISTRLYIYILYIYIKCLSYIYIIFNYIYNIGVLVVLSANSCCKLSLSPKRSPRLHEIRYFQRASVHVYQWLVLPFLKTWKFFLLLFQIKQGQVNCVMRERVEFPTAVWRGLQDISGQWP